MFLMPQGRQFWHTGMRRMKMMVMMFTHLLDIIGLVHVQSPSHLLRLKQTIKQMQHSKGSDYAFQNLSTGSWMWRNGQDIGISELQVTSLQRYVFNYTWNSYLKISKIHPGKYLTINYESTVDWRQDTDLLRCNPKFQGAPRYDHVIIKTARPTTLGTDIVAQLLMVFSITVDEATYDIALVHPLDRPSGVRQQKDIDLQLLRLRGRPRKSAEFVFLSSIIRGALVVPDFIQEGDYFLVDTVDGDMFLRYRLIK